MSVCMRVHTSHPGTSIYNNCESLNFVSSFVFVLFCMCCWSELMGHPRRRSFVFEFGILVSAGLLNVAGCCLFLLLFIAFFFFVLLFVGLPRRVLIKTVFAAYCVSNGPFANALRATGTTISFSASSSSQATFCLFVAPGHRISENRLGN